MMNAEAVIKNVAASLKPSGRFVFEMGGHGNVAQVLNAIQSAANDFKLRKLELINYYPKISEYSSLLERNGFKVTFAILFERPTLLNGEEGLQNWVRMFRNNVITSISEEQQQEFLKQVDSYGKDKLYRNGKWYADYVRLRMIAVKL
jgi:SAM-dependent methyltransferase